MESETGDREQMKIKTARQSLRDRKKRKKDFSAKTSGKTSRKHLEIEKKQKKKKNPHCECTQCFS